MDYNLSHSFRFGPTVAQAAHNVIGFNTTRLTKQLVAHDMKKQTEVQVILDSSEQATDVEKELAQQVQILLREHNVKPTDIIVLARMFVQLTGLEMEFMARGIPYHVSGQQPFFERNEIRTLLAYIEFANDLEKPVTKQAADRLLQIANTPNRKLRRETFQSAMQMGRIKKLSSLEVLNAILDDPNNKFNRGQTENLQQLIDYLLAIREKLEFE